jgi:hypothetical protein
MTETKKLPAVHLSVDDLEKIEELLREKMTNCETEIVLSFPGGIERQFDSIDQISRDVLTDIGGLNSYTLSVTGVESYCLIAGESTGTESHRLYCRGDPGWIEEIQRELVDYLCSIQTKESRLREWLTGIRAGGVTVLAALFVGWAVAAIAPQSISHYFPKLSDAIIFSIGVFGLFVVRFRNWLHPYIWIGYNRSHPTKKRAVKLGAASILLTATVLMSRYLMGPGPFLR